MLPLEKHQSSRYPEAFHARRFSLVETKLGCAGAGNLGSFHGGHRARSVPFPLLAALSVTTAFGPLCCPPKGLAQAWVQTSAPSTNWSCVACSADCSRIVAGVSNGLIYASADSGLSWTQSPAPVNAWRDLASSWDATWIFAACHGLYFSSNSAASWAPVTNAFTPISVACSADASNVAVAIGGGGYGPAVYVSTNFGGDWTLLGPLAEPVGETVGPIRSSADGSVLVVVTADHYSSPSAVILTPASNWSNHTIGADFAYRSCPAVAMSFDGATIVLPALWDTNVMPPPTNCPGLLYSTTNAGMTVITNCTAVSNWTALACSADGTRDVVVANTGEIYRSVDSGTTWQPDAAPTASWTGVASSADGFKLVAVARGGGIYTWQGTPKPVLNIERAGGGLLFSWGVPSAIVSLQEGTNLAGPWSPEAATPAINYSNLQYQVSLPAPAGTRFYRLASQ